MKSRIICFTAAVSALTLTGCSAGGTGRISATPTVNPYAVEVQVPYVTNAPTVAPDSEEDITDDANISISADGKVTILKDSWDDYEIIKQVSEDLPDENDTEVSTEQEATQDPADMQYAQLRKGDSGTDVKILQKRLKELGYYTGDITGIFDGATEQAFMAFEATCSNVCYGIASVNLLKKLYADTAQYAEGAEPTLDPSITPEPVIVIEPLTSEEKAERDEEAESAEATVSTEESAEEIVTETAAETTEELYIDVLETGSTTGEAVAAEIEKPEEIKDLEFGDSGDNVLLMQKRLKQLGYLCGEPTGEYDYYTVAAVMRFEAAYGRSITGEAGAKMQNYMYSEDAIALGSDNDEASKYGQFMDVTSKHKTVQMLWVQRRLVDLGYSSATPNGKYNDYTKDLLKKFQKNAGIESTGKADAQTLEYLYGPDAARGD